MAQTQFFSKSVNNLKDYKTNFLRALQKIKVVKLFPEEVIDFLNNWIKLQKSYIKREDVENLWKNMNLIYKDKDFYDYVIDWLKNIKSNWNILEYSFNLISELDELAKKYKNYKKKKNFKQDLEKQKEKA